MLSSMTPTILLKNNIVKMVTGSPGGTTIISSVYESILNTVEFDMSAEQVVNSPRFHHQLWPKNIIRAHKGLTGNVKEELIKMGYTINESHFGDLQVIINNDGKLDAASEATGRGKSIVF
jgi:gamma-glutamyltranspeptidase/glutathione hydrolase